MASIVKGKGYTSGIAKHYTTNGRYIKGYNSAENCALRFAHSTQYAQYIQAAEKLVTRSPEHKYAVALYAYTLRANNGLSFGSLYLPNVPSKLAELYAAMRPATLAKYAALHYAHCVGALVISLCHTYRIAPQAGSHV